MLSVPKYGWVKLKIGTWSDRASYLTDLPCELIDALIASLTNYSPACVKADAEGWEYTIVFDRFTTDIIEYKDDVEHYSFEIPVIQMAQEVYADISKNPFEWSLWDWDAENETKRAKNERVLREKLAQLKSAMDNYKCAIY